MNCDRIFHYLDLRVKSENHGPGGLNGLTYYNDPMTETLYDSFPLSMKLYDTNGNTISDVPSVKQNLFRGIFHLPFITDNNLPKTECYHQYQIMPAKA